MRIAVFGATGMVGSAVVTEGLARGHRLDAISRHPRQDVRHERLTSRALDVTRSDALASVLDGVDAAVLAVRLRPGSESDLAPLTRGVLDAAQQQGIRVLIVGGAAPLRSPGRPDRLLIDDPDHVPPAWRTVAQASLDQYRLCNSHQYTGWVYLSPPAVLERGTRSGHYRRGAQTLITDRNGASRITAPDLAIAVLDELESPGPTRHFTVAERAGH